MKALIAHTENGATAMRGHEYQSMAPIGMAATRVKAPSKMGGSNIGGMAATRKALTMRDDRAVKLLGRYSALRILPIKPLCVPIRSFNLGQHEEIILAE